MFSLPDLKSLRSYGFGTIESTHHRWISSPKASAIENIRLDLGALNTFDVGEVLGACKALRKCDIRWSAFDSPDGDDDNELLDCELDTETLLTALLPHAGTLERLVLTNIRDDGRVFETPFSNSLQRFQKLRKLKIDENLLVPDGAAWDHNSLRDKLPPNFTKLVIHSNSDFGYLGGILEACSEYHGHLLNDLRITFYHEDEWMIEKYSELYETNQSAGDRSWFIGVDSYENWKRLAFKCWAQPMWPLLSELATLVADNGLSHLTCMQLTPTQDSDGEVLGTSVAALTIHENEEAAGDDAKGS